MSAFYNVESLKTISRKEVPELNRLARIIYKKDKKTGIEKESKGLFVAAITENLLQVIANDPRGSEFLRNAVAGVQDSVIRKLVDNGKLVINSDEIDYNAILATMAQANETSGARFSKESITAWFNEYLLAPLTDAIKNKLPTMGSNQLDKLLSNYLESFQILAGRNPSMSNKVKESLIRAMEFLPEDHDSAVACTIAEKLAAVSEASIELMAL